MLPSIGFLIGSLVLGASPRAIHQDDEGLATEREVVREKYGRTRPDPQGTPTLVEVGLYTLDVEAIDDLAQSFTVDMFVALEWSDPRLAREAPGDSSEPRFMGFDEVWTPDMMLYNQRSIEKRLPDVVSVSSTGRVKYRQRIYGSFSAPLDLREFPLDQQILPISVVSLSYGPDELKFVVDDIGRDPDFSIPGWEIGPGEPHLGTLLVNARSGPAEKVELVRLDYEFPAQRHELFYTLKVIAPLTLIMTMAMVVFWIGSRETGIQVRVATTACLTLIAFLFGLGQYLPPVSYLTRIDYFVFHSLALVFLAFLKVMLCLVLGNAGKEGTVARIDGVTRWLFLAGFAGIQVAFWV